MCIKSKLFLTALFLTTGIGHGVADEAVSNLVINLKDGSKMVCLLSDEPKLTFSLSELTVKTEKTSFTVLLDNLAKFGFESSTSAIGSVGADGGIDYTLDGDRLFVKGLSAGARVELFRIDGVRMFEKTNRTENGSLEISVGSFSPGVYLLKMNDTTAKIVIR